MKNILIFSVIYAISSFLCAAPITTAMKADAENTIKKCDNKYKQIEEEAQKFSKSPPKKPNLFSLPATKENYKLFPYKVKALQNTYVIPFALRTNNKIKIRTAKSAQELTEEASAFGMFCDQAYQAALNFIKWAQTGKANSLPEQILFNEAVNQARCGKDKC